MNDEKYIPNTLTKSFKITSTSRWLLLPFVLALSIVPLVIRLHFFPTRLSDMDWFGNNIATMDFFLYYKSFVLIVLSAIMLLTMLLYRYISGRKMGFHTSFIPLYVYLFFVILSTLFSKYSYFSYHGIEHHFESVFVLLSYGIMALYGAYFVTDKTSLKWVLNGWLIGTIALVLIGVAQAFGYDIFLSKFIIYIMVPSRLWGTGEVTLNVPMGQTYMTLYNPNYVGYFAALTTPIFLIMCLFSKEWWQKVLYGITVIGIMICLFGSQARNGMFALITSFLVLIIAFRKYILKYWLVFVGIFCVVLITFFGINEIKHNRLVLNIKSALHLTETASNQKLQDIETLDDCISIKYKGNTCKVRMEAGSDPSTVVLTFIDSQGNYIPYMQDTENASLMISDDRFPFTAQVSAIDDMPVFRIIIDDTYWVFTNRLSKEGYYYMNSASKWVKIEAAKSAIFTNYPLLASGRGYIWSRSIPLLKDTLFIGTGPDTFVMSYPHKDYVAASYVGFRDELNTKPHNLYLQMGVQTGVVSVIAFIVFFLLYMISAIKLYWRHPLNTYLSQIGVAILAATLGYMISGIINDSTVVYSFVYWGLIGVGIAVNHLVRQSLQSNL